MTISIRLVLGSRQSPAAPSVEAAGGSMTVPLAGRGGYPRGMPSSADQQPEAVDLNAGADPQERAEARAWAKRVLAEARARRTPERLNEMRAKVGMPPLPA